jgi:hypothetical protein
MDISHFFTNVRLAFRSQVIDHNLNPVHLAIARRGYAIQSNVLRIPDRFGFFAPGPPRLQAYNGAKFAALVLVHGFLFVWETVYVALYVRRGWPNPVGVTVYLMAVHLIFFSIVYVATLLNPRRLPYHTWEDWKLRRE